MRVSPTVAGLAAALPLACVHAQTPDLPAAALGTVTITGGRASALPSETAATRETVTREQIAQTVNAADSEDALKYLPSLLVRKRYPGDYNHAVLSSRASGTGNSARSLVYADGILLSNLLGNGVGGLGFPPRWGLVTPEEVERVDVLYGPFSAAYPGNSAGAVVEYLTRMPEGFEAHGRVALTSQPFDLDGTQDTYRSWQASASAGNRAGAWSWWFHFQRSDNESQPLVFANRLASAGGPATGTPVGGAVAGRNSADQPWYLLGTSTVYHTRQDHVKAKLALDISPTLRASYLAGLWQNRAAAGAQTWLRDAAGRPVTSGAVVIDGRGYTLTGADFPLIRERLTHAMQGASLKRHGGGEWTWELAASRYGYLRDDKRQNAAANPLPAAATGGAGTLADGRGSGWSTLSAHATWRPVGAPHVVEIGAQQESYRLAYTTTTVGGNWLQDGPGAAATEAAGRTRLQSLWAQDAWRFAPGWKAVLGLRAEHWTASQGRTRIAAAVPVVNSAWARRDETWYSPKASVAWQLRPSLRLQAALGRAVRMPTAGELYGATSTANAQFINDPALRPERSWTAELGAEQDLGRGLVRLTWFAERTRDALYSQTTLDPLAGRNITRVQNVGRIATRGLELAALGSDVGAQGLDLSGSVTYAQSLIRENAGFVGTPGDTLGRWQPNVPRWRATALATWRASPRTDASLALRYSGRQYRTLDNSDVNGAAYMGVSRLLVADLRVRHRLDRHTQLAAGIDNLNNARYWNFHPYPQRSFFAELRIDL